MLLSGKAEIVARSNNKLASVVIVDHASMRARVLPNWVRAYDGAPVMAVMAGPGGGIAYTA
jgi:hypothetical protein